MENKENKMVLITDFIQQYSTAASNTAKQKICQNIMTRKYVPVMEKYVAISSVFSGANRLANNLIFYNSFVEYVSYTMSIIKLYTNLTNGEMTMMDAYDALSECGAVADILNTIGERELLELNRIRGFISSDAERNECSPYAYFATQIGRVIDHMEGFKEILNDEEKFGKVKDLLNININRE
ncbi:MAG: hypothetical protein MJZ16_07990 [Bacteroidales bacterium]|nr:hypothetical protein [Bacteroidales bacterium]